MKESGFSNVLVIILVLVTVVGGVFLLKNRPTFYKNDIKEPHPADTVKNSTPENSQEVDYSEWNTFYSKTYDISIKYPTDWEAKEGRLNHLGVENKDVIPCGETWGKYFKNLEDCNTNEIDAPYIEIYKLEPETHAETNNISFSVMQFGTIMGTDGYFERDFFDLTEKNIKIGNKNLIQTSFSGFTTPAYNKGFQVTGVNTGEKSIFSKLNVFAAARPTKPEYSELDTLEKILYSLQAGKVND